jgi:hypothetical protein
MLEEYLNQLEECVEINDDPIVHETMVYYIGFINGLLSVGAEPDEGFINIIKQCIKGVRNDNCTN